MRGGSGYLKSWNRVPQGVALPGTSADGGFLEAWNRMAASTYGSKVP